MSYELRVSWNAAHTVAMQSNFLYMKPSCTLPILFFLGSHLPAPWHSFTLTLLELSLKLAQGVLHIIYITTEPGGIRQGWGSVVPAAIQPLSTKIVPGPKRFLSWILTGRPEGDDGFPDASDSKCKLLWVVVFRKTSSSLAGVSNKAAKLRYPEIISSWWCKAHSSQPVACNTHRTEIKWTQRFHKFIMSPA